MKIRIYQINMERDTNRVAFESLELLERYQGNSEIDSAIYDKVYECEGGFGSLEDVFRTFNLEHPADYTGRSMSVSDIVEVVEGDTVSPGFYFCDSIGFKAVNFQPEAAVRPERDTIRVVLLEPGKLSRIADIGASLEGMQRAVGGYIEPIYPFDEEVCIICNEEGKINGLPLNRSLRDEDTGKVVEIIAGPCFICDCSGERFGSLSQEQLERYAKKFRNPEQFIMLNDEIIAIPYKPNNRDHESR